MGSGHIVGAVMVPGMPHLLAGDPDPAWRSLRHAAEEAGRDLLDDVDAWLVLSTQWFTVLGFQFHVRPTLSGTHVDDNWYDTDYGEFTYDVRTAGDLVHRWADIVEATGTDVHRTDVDGFPMDTGTLTALRLVDPDASRPVAIASLNLYAGPEAMGDLGESARKAVEAGDQRVGVIVASGLSAAVRQEWLVPGTDAIAHVDHDHWNRRMLDHFTRGDLAGALALRAEYASAASVDSQFRALTFLAGTGAIDGRGEVMEYGPIWGTGAAVVRWHANTRSRT